MPHYTLSYDPLMRLKESKVTSSGAGTRFAYDGLEMIAEYDTAGAIQRRYVFGPGIDEPLVEYTGSGTTNRKWLHADERGSIVAMSDGTGAVTQINKYDEFGKPQSTNTGRFQYTGQAWLPELNGYYYKARVYAPHIGRFLQTDPIGYGDGLNLYAYVGNDPVNLTDPLGLQQEPVQEIVVTGTAPSPPPQGEASVQLAQNHALFVNGLAMMPNSNRRENRPMPPRLPKTQIPTPCQRAFLKDQLNKRGLPVSQIDSLKFVSGLNSNANALTRQAFNGGATAVTQGSTVYVQPGSFVSVANFRSPTGFEEAYHSAQFASNSGFYRTYGILGIGGIISMGDSYKGNAYEAFAKGAAMQMFQASREGMCSK